MSPSAGALTLDLAGVFVFALAGALAAVGKRLDIVGVAVLGTVAAIGGGLLRDVLLGDVPPPALADWRYVAVSAAASVIVFFYHPQVSRLTRAVRLFDAAGLGLFAVAGTAKALDAGLGPVPACLLGVLTGIGGGLLRDLLLGEIPLVLRTGELYAVTALAGSLVVIAADALHVYGPTAAAAAVALVFLLRVAAIRRHWSAPLPRGVEDH
ncbi:MAG: trimeric intracellular cation channel family protein [Actinomycetes bacterium]